MAASRASACSHFLFRLFPPISPIEFQRVLEKAVDSFIPFSGFRIQTAEKAGKIQKLFISEREMALLFPTWSTSEKMKLKIPKFQLFGGCTMDTNFSNILRNKISKYQKVPTFVPYHQPMRVKERGQNI